MDDLLNALYPPAPAIVNVALGVYQADAEKPGDEDEMLMRAQAVAVLIGYFHRAFKKLEKSANAVAKDDAIAGPGS